MNKRKELQMKRYQRLNFMEREELSRYLSHNLSYRAIARILGRSPSTVFREVIKNNFTRLNYRDVNTQNNAINMSKMNRKQKKRNINHNLRKIIFHYLKLRWLPEQIAKRLRILYPNDMSMHISHETIYSYIYIHPRNHLKRK